MGVSSFPLQKALRCQTSAGVEIGAGKSHPQHTTPNAWPQSERAESLEKSQGNSGWGLISPPAAAHEVGMCGCLLPYISATYSSPTASRGQEGAH